MNVLIVDDDRIALEMLEHRLTDWGYNVVAARDGVEGWERFQAGGFSIVVTDWQMPRMDGLDLLHKVRGAAADAYVYCILLTVRSQLADLIRGMDAGADDFLTKPFEPGELRVRLRAGQRIIELERSLRLANERVRRELKTAARIQQALLPVKAAEGDGRFAWGYKPCDELGGDILNVIPLVENKVALYLLDVSGHGVSAALLSVALSRLLTTSSNASSLIREIGPSGYHIVPPAEVLTRLNERFFRDLGGERFFTIMYGVLDLQSHELFYASGGHVPALIVGEISDVKQLASTGPALGYLEEAQFEQCTARLQPSDRLVIYSDGMTEAVNVEDQQFGVERLIQAVQECQALPMQDMLDAVMRRIEGWSQPRGLQDDASCLAAQAPPTTNLLRSRR